MASTHPSIPVLDLAGTPGQVGAAHGESQRDRIRDYAERFLGWLLSTVAVRLTEQQLWDRWAPQAEPAWARDTGDRLARFLGVPLLDRTALS